jgi:hypothetical protein
VTAAEDQRPVEKAALLQLADHARTQAVTLAATAELRFLLSMEAGAYDTSAVAAAGSRVVDTNYLAWDASPAAAQAASDTQLQPHVDLLQGSWWNVHRNDLSSGTRPASVRYASLAEAAENLAAVYAPDLPSSSLPSLLELSKHAREHSARLEATPDAVLATSGEPNEQAITRDNPAASQYVGLPAKLAELSSHAHSHLPKTGDQQGQVAGADTSKGPNPAASALKGARSERER